MQIDFRLALIPGHTPTAYGAMGVAPINKGEHLFCAELCAVAYRYARECGLNCKVFTRKDNESIFDIYEQVNKWAKDGSEAMAIEVHFNASLEHKAEGTETLFFSEQSIEAAREIHDEIVSVLGRKGKLNRGLKKLNPGDRGAANLKAMQVTGCLIEPFFGDNPKDAALGFSKSWEIAQAIAKAAFKYMVQKSSRDNRLDLV